MFSLYTLQICSQVSLPFKRAFLYFVKEFVRNQMDLIVFSLDRAILQRMMEKFIAKHIICNYSKLKAIINQVLQVKLM